MGHILVERQGQSERRSGIDPSGPVCRRQTIVHTRRSAHHRVGGAQRGRSGIPPRMYITLQGNDHGIRNIIARVRGIVRGRASGCTLISGETVDVVRRIALQSRDLNCDRGGRSSALIEIIGSNDLIDSRRVESVTNAHAPHSAWLVQRRSDSGNTFLGGNNVGDGESRWREIQRHHSAYTHLLWARHRVVAARRRLRFRCVQVHKRRIIDLIILRHTIQIVLRLRSQVRDGDVKVPVGLGEGRDEIPEGSKAWGARPTDY
mmetsp:Transcript_37609/g.90354  ORF Transcript_37609/g.90354 Transcript_37609/m.90354 type:complete len:261 (-) Transcript_37609:605-1387(-)